MSKGQRARASRAGQKEERKKLELKQRRRKKITSVIGICVAVVIVLGIAASITVNAIADTGYFLRNTVVMSTDNYKVDNAMMTYYLKNQYYSFTNQYSDYLSMYGLDTSKSLKSQNYGEGTWFDYFLSQTQTQVKNLMSLAEKANAEGYKLEDSDKEDIENSIKSFAQFAEQNGVSTDEYLASVFGKGIKEADVRRAMELSTLASKYYTDYEDTLKYTDDDFQKYFDEHKSEFIKADYIKYDFTASFTEGMTDEQKTAEKDRIQALADKFSAIKKESEFKAELEKYLTEKYTAENTDSETSVEDRVAGDLENISLTKYLPEEKKADDDTEKTEDVIATWLFTNGRKAGDTYVEKSDESSEIFGRSVYLVTKPRYFDDYATVNVGHILFTEKKYESDDGAKAKANEILAEFKKDATAEKFSELAGQYSEDTTAQDGMYNSIENDTSAFPKAFLDWSFSKSRKAGDTEVVKADDGYHLMYFKGKGDIAWKAKANTSIREEAIETYLNELAETYKVTVKESKLKKIKA